MLVEIATNEKSIVPDLMDHFISYEMAQIIKQTKIRIDSAWARDEIWAKTTIGWRLSTLDLIYRNIVSFGNIFLEKENFFFFSFVVN